MSLNDERCPTRKIAYRSKAGAKQRGRQILASGHTGLTAYRCDLCDRYHLGRGDADQRAESRWWRRQREYAQPRV